MEMIRAEMLTKRVFGLRPGSRSARIVLSSSMLAMSGGVGLATHSALPPISAIFVLSSVGGAILLDRSRRRTYYSTDELVVQRQGMEVVESLSWSSLDKVEVLTGSALGEDLWVLSSTDGSGIVIPWHHAPPNVLPRLQALADFDNTALVNATTSAKPLRVTLWVAKDPRRI